jgi:hypothetical protein
MWSESDDEGKGVAFIGVWAKTSHEKSWDFLVKNKRSISKKL